MTEFSKGDKVRIDPEFARNETHRTSTYTVVKVNQKTYGLTNDTTGAKLNADKRVVIAADAEVPERPVMREFDMTQINTGTIVQAKPGVLRGPGGDGLLVVTGHAGGTNYIGHRLSVLGGAGGTRYWGGIHPKYLTALSLEDAAAKIVDAL